MSAQPRLVVSAPSSGHGKTAIAVGLLAACAARGIPAAGFKVGPDHTDAAYLGLAAGRPGRNLDPRLVGAQRIAPLFGHGAAGAKFSVIEGAMGLFDSLTGQPEVDGTAAVAATLRAPVVLVVDVATMGHSLAALVHGFRMFDEMVHLGGVILNKVASPRHEQMLRTALDDIGMPVLGALRRGDLPNVLPARSHGPVPVAHRTVEASRAVRRLGEAVAGSLDLEHLMALAGAAPALPAPIWTPADAVGGEIFEQRPLVALAGGPGAPYTYVETAELLTAAGADVAVVDPLRDETLPAGTRALIVGAGLPEGYAEELSANRRLCNTVAKFAHDGWPVVAEGVALPWLARDFDGRPMCAVFDASAVTGEQTVAGYREATAPTTSPLAPAGARITGYKQHRAIMTPRAGAVPAWTWSGGTPEGFVWRQVHASQLGLHWAAAPEIAKRLVAAAIAGPAGQQGSAHPPTAVLIGQIVQPGRYDAAAGRGPSPVLQGQIIMPSRPDQHGSPAPFDGPGPQVVYDVAGSPGSRSTSEPDVYYDPSGTEIIYDSPASRIVYDIPEDSGPDLYDPPGSPASHPHGSPVAHDSPAPQDPRDAPGSRGYGPAEPRSAPLFSDAAGSVPYDSPGPRAQHVGASDPHEARGSRGAEDPYGGPGASAAQEPSGSRGTQGSYGSSGAHPVFGEGSRGSQAAPASSVPHEPSGPRGGQGSSGSPVFDGMSGPRVSYDAPGSPVAHEPHAPRGGQEPHEPHGAPRFGAVPEPGDPYASSGPHGSPVSYDSPGPHSSPPPRAPRGSQSPHEAAGSSAYREDPGSRGSQTPYDSPGARGSTDARGPFRPHRPADPFGPHGPADSRESFGPHGSADARESFGPHGSADARESFGPHGSADSHEPFEAHGPGDFRESFGSGGSADPRGSFGRGGSADSRDSSGPHRPVDPRDLFDSSGSADLYESHGQHVSNEGSFPPGSPHESYESRGQRGPATPGSPYPQAAGPATARPQPVPAGRPVPAGGAAEPANLADTADIITS